MPTIEKLGTRLERAIEKIGKLYPNTDIGIVVMSKSTRKGILSNKLKRDLPESNLLTYENPLMQKYAPKIPK